MSDAHMVQGSEVWLHIPWLLCPRGLKGRLKRGMKGQLPQAKLREEHLGIVSRPAGDISGISSSVNPLGH